MTEVAEKKHAVLGPSGWDTWGTCAGSVPLSVGIVDKGSSYARLGTAAHALLEDCIEGGLNAEDLLGKEYVVEGDTFVVDQEMADAVDAALNIIKDVIGDGILMSEQAVPLTHLTGELDAEGTSDIIGITDGGKTLVVMDYKHGQGVKVYASGLLQVDRDTGDESAKPNGQMAMYALGALHKYGMVYDEIEKVELHIVQPRLEHHSYHAMPVVDLLAFGDAVAQAAGRVELAREAFEAGDNLDLVPSEKGCRFCKAKHRCPALKDVTSTALAVASKANDFDDLSLPKKASSVVVDAEITNERIAEVMRAQGMIEDYLKAIRAEGERRLFAGENVPGFKIVEGKKGNRAWGDKVGALAELTKSGRLKMSEATTATIISPTAAEKLLKERPKIWSKIAPLITQNDGKPSVAPESDPRPAYRLASEENEFENLSVQPALSHDDLLG